MKKFFLVSTGFIFCLSMIAQGNSNNNGKEKDKSKNEKSVQHGSSEQKEKEANEKKQHEEHNKKIWDGTSDNGKGPMPSKNQPTKVSAAFQRDYPNAANVSWSKYRGDWTASFGNGWHRSTAVYHANGERRDTRTPVTRNEMPQNVLDAIFKRSPETRLEDVIKIEVPNIVKDIFRVKDILGGKPTYFYYRSDGQLVKYNY
jgi:leucyl aminopeptidase (aminopeptidase T)